MREIKFRGYAVEEMVESQWLYGFGVKNIDYVDGTVEWHLHTLNGVYEVEPESIGQYTGLKDKNGREIYEGDIVECFVNGNSYVSFKGGVYGLISDYSFIPFSDVHGKMKVIGNIYENKQLLEVARND